MAAAASPAGIQAAISIATGIQPQPSDQSLKGTVQKLDYCGGLGLRMVGSIPPCGSFLPSTAVSGDGQESKESLMAELVVSICFPGSERLC